jgi:mannosyltransferase
VAQYVRNSSDHQKYSTENCQLMGFDRERQDPRLLLGDAKATAAPQWPPIMQAIKSRPAMALALALAMLALALRLYRLADQPFWYDEILTWGRAKLPLGELVINALKHKHFPTYFLLVGPFAFDTHSPEWMLRLPSVLFGAACVFLVTRLAADARGLRAGLVAGLLMAASPIEVAFAQDARPYTLISCLVLIAICGLLRIAQNPKAAACPITQSNALRGAWAAYGLGTLGALLVENNTIPFLLASNLTILVIVLRGRTIGLARNWAWSQGLIALVWLPLVLIMWWVNRGAVLDGLQWIPKASWETIRSAAGALYLFRITDMMTLTLRPSMFPAFGILIAFSALFGAWRLKQAPDVLVVIGLAFLAMPIAVLALAPYQPLLVPRYLLWSTGPYFVLAGAGLAALPARFFAPAALLVAVGAALNLAPYYGMQTKPRWNEALSYLAARARAGDIVVAQNVTVAYFLHAYGGRFSLPPQIPILWGNPGHPGELNADGGRFRLPQFPILSGNPGHPGEDLCRVVAAERAWIVYGRVGQGPQQPEANFRQEWSGLGAPAAAFKFGSSILVLRFDHICPARRPHEAGPGNQKGIEPPAASGATH